MSEILSYDLNLYNYDQPQLCGVKEEILCSKTGTKDRDVSYLG